MAQNNPASSVNTYQITCYHHYIQEVKDGAKHKGSRLEKQENGQEGPYRYGSITNEESDIFSSQFVRISSFHSALNSFAKYSVLQLAQDGFFNTQKDKEIKCFSCGLLFHPDLDVADPLALHRHSNRCLHIRGADKSNVPFGDFVPCNHLATEVNQTATERSDAAPDVDEVSRSLRSTVHLGERETSLQTPLPDPNLNRNEVPIRQDPTPVRNNRHVQRHVVITDYRLELCRLQSFKNWPSNAAVKPDDLANAGFFYLDTDDRVQCVFCRGILRSWEPDDRALAEHLRHFPQCPFLMDPQSVGNVPLGEEDESVFSSSIQLREGSSSQDDLMSNPLPGVHLERPSHPNYAQVQERLKSFQDFPSNAFQKAEDLVRAGFFYTGQIDAVRCFFCSVTLRSWKPQDDPWVEHVKASRNCGYIRMTKGEKFIEEILKNNRNPEKVDKSEKRKLRQKAIQGTKHKVSVGEVQQVMRSSAVHSVLDMDIANEEIVQKVVQKRLQQLGNPFPNAEALIEAISEFKEEEAISSESSASDTDDSSDSSFSAKSSATASQQKPVPDSPDLPDDEATLRSQNQELREERLCKVCLDEMATIVFLKCGHLVCCSSCAPAMSKCPVCRQNVVGTIRVDM